MLDTLKLRSPYVEEAVARAVEARLVLRQGIDLSTGELLYALKTGQLLGSWDHEVSCQVKRQEWAADGNGKTVQRDCPPYVVIEGSVHKALLGHNIAGGPLDPVAAGRWFVYDVGRRLDVQLPGGDWWTVERADWAEVYDLGDFAAVHEYMRAICNADYPRRKRDVRGHESITFPGVTTRTKAYHKGPEFLKHDHPRLKARMGDEEAARLLSWAHCLLRCEVEVKARKLDDDFGKRPRVVEVTQAYLERVHDREISRTLREGQGTMTVVRTHREVKRRLLDLYGNRLGSIYFGTWLQLSAMGEAAVKLDTNRKTFWRHRKALTEAGCSWHGSDVVLREHASLIPQGFAPVRSDPRRLVEEAPRVTLQLAPFALAA